MAERLWSITLLAVGITSLPRDDGHKARYTFGRFESHWIVRIRSVALGNYARIFDLQEEQNERSTTKGKVTNNSRKL